MAKCSNCGRKGLFLKLDNGLCNDCAIVARNRRELEQLAFEKGDIELQIATLRAELADQQALFESIETAAREAGVAQAMSAMRAEQENAERLLAELHSSLESARADLTLARSAEEKAIKNAASAVRKVDKHRTILHTIEHVIRAYESDTFSCTDIDRIIKDAEDFVSPTVTLDLRCLGMKDLRKRFRQNEKAIEEALEKYEGRYTTKSNATIYKLMVIALRAELQNVLYSISYGRLEDALSAIATITKKYFDIAVAGNQSIAPTLKKFIAEIDYLFQEAVKIEYEYYVQKERAKEEQRAIREQMRQEAEDRRALEAEKKKIEKEENKFHDQISKIEDQIKESAGSDRVTQLEARLAELQAQLAAVVQKKDVISTLQNGKAGNVYVISNLGSFGDNVFKIGMTRRAEPQDRINELGDASVPFPFDVHSLIFSDDAAALEHKIHNILNDRRVNKVNLRKEFFNVSLNELESLIEELAPTAEFKRTMLAEQYRQSLSIDKVVASISDFDEDE